MRARIKDRARPRVRGKAKPRDRDRAKGRTPVRLRVVGARDTRSRFTCLPAACSLGLTPVTVQGQDNPNGEQSTAPTNADNNTTGQALTPYEDVYGQYKDQAGEALGSDYIPQGYKDLVRDYFSQIAPK